MEELIEAVRKQPMLWDLGNKFYKDNGKKTDAWKVVATESHLTEDTARLKWKGLRDSFLKYLKGQKPITGQGCKRKKEWVYAETMAFLKPVLSGAKTSSNIPHKVTVETIDEEMLNPIFELTGDSSVQPSNTPAPSRPKQNYDGVKEVLKFLETKKSLKENFDARDFLFLSYAKTFKTFSKKRQILLKKRLADLFLHAEYEEVCVSDNCVLSPNCFSDLSEHSTIISLGQTEIGNDISGEHNQSTSSSNVSLHQEITGPSQENYDSSYFHS